MRIHDGDLHHPDDKGPPRAGFFVFAPRRFKSAGKIEETPEQKELASIASEQYGIYESDFIPLENKAIDRVQNNEFDRSAALGSANLESSRAFAKAKGQVEAAQTNAGARPGSGRFNLSGANLAVDQGESSGLALGGANLNADNRKLAGLSALVNIGRGKSAEALTGLSGTANLAANQANVDASNAAANRGATLGAIGAGAGLAAASYGARANPATTAGSAATGKLNAGGTFTVNNYEGL